MNVLLTLSAETTGGISPWLSENLWVAFLPALCAAIPGIINAIAQVKDKKYSKLTQLIEETKKENKTANDVNKGLIEELKNKLEEQDEVDELHKEALKTLLRENIDEMYQLYYKQYGYLPDEARDELEETFDIYSKLGGNHIGERKYNKLKELPDEPDGEKAELEND